MPAGRPPLLFLLFFTVFWCALTLAFDVIMIVQLRRQLDADARFLPVDAVVATSRVESSTGSKGGTTYRPEITFAYTVNGVDHVGTTVSLSEWGSNDSRAHDLVKSHPPGKRVTAYYDPDEPSKAILIKGFGGFPTILPLFMTPFNCVALGMIGMTISAARSRGRVEGPAGGLIIRDDPERAVLRAPTFHPGLAFLLGLGISSFVGIFVLILSTGGGMSPPVETVGIAMGICFALGVVALGLTLKAKASPRHRLTIDRRLRQLVPGDTPTPASPFAPVPTFDHGGAIAFKDIRDLRLASKTIGNVNGRALLSHRVRVTLADGKTRDVVTVRGDQARGEAVERWLREQVGLAAEPADGARR
ncbi:MAG: DUF3592 domain-containing protein [Phycisphaeraceae bacterium]|nr:MAG: DUF3592 domain-containing protein [Phycisphaeraceae bacterium]